MREMLFRGKVKYNGNHKFAGDWVIGNPIKIRKEKWSEKLKTMMTDYWGTAIQTTVEENGKYYKYVSYEVIPETVGQFTGTEGINKVKIFEGQKVLMHYFGFNGSETDNEVIGVVIFDVHEWCVVNREGKIYPFGLMEEPSEEIEVIHEEKNNEKE
jgi:hypothetical protein